MLAFTNPLNESALAFPVLECIHIVGFAFSIGTIAFVDLRMLGLGGKQERVSDLARDLSLWTLAGIVCMVMSGLLLFSSDPDKYYLNGAFQAKMVCLVLAIVFNYTFHRKVVYSDAPSPARTAAAYVSLGLWVSVIFGGIFIAFVGAP